MSPCGRETWRMGSYRSGEKRALERPKGKADLPEDRNLEGQGVGFGVPGTGNEL